MAYDILIKIWHWPDPQWSDGALEKDLFRSYINAMLKIKVKFCQFSNIFPHLRLKQVAPLLELKQRKN